MDSVLKDIKETMGKLESTMIRVDPIFDVEQREMYKELLSNFSPHAKVSTPGFLQFVSLILQGKPTSQARKHVRQEIQENTVYDEEIRKGFKIVDTLPFGDIKKYYYTVLEQGLEDANLLWIKRERRVFEKVVKDTTLHEVR